MADSNSTGYKPKRSIQNSQIVIIGAGNLGTNLALAIYKKGFRIVQVYSRTEEAARQLAGKVESAWTTDISHITAEASLYIVALKDDALVELVPQLVAVNRNALWLHTAGSIPMEIWQGHATHYGVLYPMQTFSKQREVDFSELSIFIEGSSAEDSETLMAIASSLTRKVYETDSLQRRKLHLAAVFACNFTNHLYALSAEVLQEAAIPFDVMLPLIDETARKVHELSPQDAQTGPAVRNDTNVINSHLGMLEGKEYMKEVYLLLTEGVGERG